MGSPLEGIAFLARSENRVRVLRSLDDDPRSRAELRDELGIPRTTLARILNEFEDRGLIARDGQPYATTETADAVLSKFVPLLETMEGIDALGEAIEWLPPPARELEFANYRDTDIVTPPGEDPTAHFDRGFEAIRAASTYRGLTWTSIPQVFQFLADAHLGGRMDVEHVIEARFLETIRDDDERARPWAEVADAIRVYDGYVPISMHVVDGRVLVWLGERHGDRLSVHGLLESENREVLRWAESLYEEYRAESVPLDPSTLPDVG